MNFDFYKIWDFSQLSFQFSLLFMSQRLCILYEISQYFLWINKFLYFAIPVLPHSHCINYIVNRRKLSKKFIFEELKERAHTERIEHEWEKMNRWNRACRARFIYKDCKKIDENSRASIFQLGKNYVEEYDVLLFWYLGMIRMRFWLDKFDS